MDFDGLQWSSMDFNGFERIGMGFNEIKGDFSCWKPSQVIQTYNCLSSRQTTIVCPLDKLQLSVLDLAASTRRYGVVRAKVMVQVDEFDALHLFIEADDNRMRGYQSRSF